MTSPNLEFPSGAYTTGTISHMQTVTKQQIATQKSADVQALLGQVKATFIQNLLGGFFNVVDAIGNAITQFIRDLVYALKGVTGGFVDLTGFFQDTKTVADEALSSTINTGQVIRQVQTDVETISAPFADSYETMIPGQQVSFPQILLNSTVKDLRDGSPSGTAQNEQVIIIVDSQDPNTYLNFSRVPRYIPSVNQVESAFILSNYAVGRGNVSFAVDAVGGSPAPLYVYISRMKSNGDVVVEWVSPNQTPLMTSGRAERTITLPEQVNIPFDIGEYMVVSIHQVGSGTIRPLLGIERTPMTRSSDVFPNSQKFHINSSSPLSSGTNISKGDLIFTSNWVPWVGIGQRLFTGDPLPRTWFDDFQRSEIGPKWNSVGGRGIYILGGRFSYQQGFASDGDARGLYTQPLAYDDQQVAGVLGQAPNGGLTSEPAKLLYKSNAAGTTFCSLDVRDGSVTLARMVNNSPAVMGVFNVGNSVGDSFRVTCVGPVHTGWKKPANSSTWTAIIQWTDSTTSPVIPSGEGYRFTGVSCQRYSFVTSPSWENYEAADLVEVVTP